MVELYVSRADSGAVERAATLTRAAAAQMTRMGTPVRFLRSIYAAEDETCFFLYEAETAGDVEEAARRASLEFDHGALAVAARKAEDGLP